MGQHLKEFILGTWGMTRFRNIPRLFFYVNFSAVCQRLVRLFHVCTPTLLFGPERVSKPNKGHCCCTTLNNQTSEACQPTDNDWWENCHLKLRSPDATVLSGQSQFSVARPESQQKLVGTLKCPSIHQTLSTVSCFPRLHSQHVLSLDDH